MMSVEGNEAPGARPDGAGNQRESATSRLPRVNGMGQSMARAALAIVSPVLFSPLLLAPSYAQTADNEAVADLRRMVRQLQSQNRELSRRLGALEGAPAVQRSRPAAGQERSSRAQAAPGPSPAGAPPRALPEPRDTTGMSIEQRVRELETAWVVQEDATRQILRDTLQKTGPNINSFIALSGVIEVVASRSRDFGQPVKDNLTLGTAELDFDIKLTDWLAGSMVLAFDRGATPAFPTTNPPAPPVDRFTLDRTNIRIGDLTQFPVAARFGYEVLHFGTSTGVARLDTLSINTPLTTAVFENRQIAGGIEFAFPTPPLQPPGPLADIPPVRPLVVAPLVSNLMRAMGYTPLPQRAVRPVRVRPAVVPAPVYGSFVVYNGSDRITPHRARIQEFNASLGYRASGHCGVPYEELKNSLVCPWTFDFHVDYNTSVFESKFLHATYLPFLDQIGRIPGAAASVKTSFGPFLLVGEINSATKRASFLDGLGSPRNMKPLAWQVSLGYQFDWNPWVVEIGAQGNFVSVAYSGTKDMAGATALINGELPRVGFVPEKQLLITAGEWPMEGLKLAVEYSAAWDYPVASGGTGQTAHGVFGLVQLNF
jgi:hypothetical protein